MKRPATVVVTTVLLALGGLLCAAMAALMVWALAMAGPPDARASGMDPGLVAVMSYFLVGFFLLISLWQIVTATGVWRLIPWSRISLLTFSGLLVTFQGLGLLMVFFLPLAEMADGRTDVLATMRLFLFVFYGAPVAIGIWWLIYFTRPHVKALFSPGGVLPEELPRPTSIVVIGWFLASSAPVMPLVIWWEWPAILMGVLLTGWSAALVHTFWAGFTLYTGVQLLRWKMSGYYAALALSGFGAVNALVFWLIPGSTERMQELVDSMRISGLEPANAPDPVLPSPELSIAIGLLSVGLPVYFLLTRKAKFIAMSELKRKAGGLAG